MESNQNNKEINEIFSGYITALVTPFTSHHQIDYESFDKLLNHQYNNGIKAVVIGGTTGEGPTLEDSEYQTLIARAKSQFPDLFVIGGKSSNSTASAIALARDAAENGADAVMAVTPYYNKPSQEGIYKHFSYINSNVNIPIMLYDVPGRTGTKLELETIYRLTKLENIIALKDATGEITRPQQIKLELNDKLKLLSGEDPNILAYLAHGGDGCVSVTSNAAPLLCNNLYQYWQNRDIDQAQKTANNLFNMHKAMFISPSPAPVKYLLKKLGIISEDILRSPLCGVSSDEAKQIDDLTSQIF